jgi:hypothetical protein
VLDWNILDGADVIDWLITDEYTNKNNMVK